MKCFIRFRVWINDMFALSTPYTIHNGSKSLKAYAPTTNATVNWMKQFSCTRFALCRHFNVAKWLWAVSRWYGCEKLWSFWIIIVNHAGETCGMWIVRIFWFDGFSETEVFRTWKSVMYKILAIMFAICLAMCLWLNKH